MLRAGRVVVFTFRQASIGKKIGFTNQVFVLTTFLKLLKTFQYFSYKH
uniref:Uncharacterized protein n=1 Tax=Heterorhabditis bacteriophora TaxID=37862 RepID=A0A1I7WF87_HETBA